MIMNLHVCDWSFVYLAFSREDLRELFSKLNKQRDKLKKMGIKVDGKHYCIRFKSTGSKNYMILKIPLIFINEIIGDTYLWTLKK